MAGFQLLDIQDYPGQGSAFVGILDAFMESKGITTPEEWRQWCSPVVPLLEMKKFCFVDGEKIQAKVKVANYGSNTNAASDLGVAALNLKAGLQGAWLNVLINISGIKDQDFVQEYHSKGIELLQTGSDLADNIYQSILESLS